MVPTDTEAQAAAIATFREITTVSTDSEARRQLQAANWDLSLATTQYLDRPNTPPSASPRSPSPETTVVTTTRALPRWLATLIHPIRLIWSVVSHISEALQRLLGGPARAIALAPGDTPARRFESFFDEQYGASHPPFFNGAYLSALSAAHAELKFLLVYLHSDAHRLTPAFCREVLASRSFQDAAEACVFWAGSVTQRDGAAAQHALRVAALPFLALVAAPPGAQGLEIGRASFGTLLAVRSGASALAGGGEGAAEWLRRALARHAPMIEAVRAAREERESARLLREQQDLEYAEALEADRRREREAEDARRQVDEQEQRLKEREMRRERKRESLGTEPEKGPGICSVVLRLPDGTRVGRRFDKDEVLEKVFDWAEVNSVDIEVACLVTTYPRSSFRYPEDAGRTLQEAGLFPSAMLLLEERADGE